MLWGDIVYQVYKILDSDTLDSIASSRNISSDEIIRLNGISFDEFIPGNMIVLPKDDEIYYTYNVLPGDTLYSIANKFNQDVSTLYSINGIKDGDYIYPNQRLLIPKSGVSFYISKDGDTLNFVSENTDVSISDIIKNNSNIYLLPDQVIVYKRD